jgi:uncharacterized protein (TIGR02246 family)
MNGIEVMEAMTKAYNAKDLDAMMDLITEDCIMQKDRGEVLVAGKPAFREMYAAGFKNNPNMVLELKDHFSVGSALFIHERNHGWVIDGEEKTMDTSWAYQVVNGKIALMHYYSIDYTGPSMAF